jgi:hypothetical protein
MPNQEDDALIQKSHFLVKSFQEYLNPNPAGYDKSTSVAAFQDKHFKALISSFSQENSELFFLIQSSRKQN